jgi:hypothetical protein
VKAVNRGLANEFHAWQRSALPGCVIQDIDAWAIIASDPDTYEPLALFELKRSFATPDQWSPYPEDRPNYASLATLASRAEIPFYVVYWQKGNPIEDETPFRVVMFTEVSPEYHGVAKIMSAAEFAERFPYPIRTLVSA